MLAFNPGVLSFDDYAFTFRDMNVNRDASVPVLIRARALTGFDTLVRRYDADPAHFFRAAGMPPDVLDNPEHTVPLAQLARLLDATARALTVPDFGLQLSREQDISVLGAIALIARYSQDFASALEGVARHLPYHTPGASLRWQDGDRPDEIAIHYDLSLGDDVPRAQAMELSYAVAWNFLHMISGESAANWRIRFRHAAHEPVAQYRSYFSGTLEFDQPVDALIVPRRLLAVPISSTNAELRAITERFVSHVRRRHPLDLGAQVAALIERQLAGGGCSIARIARQLGLHVRTVQRQLAGQGLYFEDIIDRVRRERADEFLRQPVVPLAQIALLLGYTEQSSFNRACLRWFGTTPLARRQSAGH